MRANKARRPVRGFTLIELLLVIAMIALLASLLMPSLQRAQTKVRSAQCKSNEHQLGLGMISFAHGHEDKFPMQVSTNFGGSQEFINAGNAVNGEFYFGYRHFAPLGPELETPKILLCPADRGREAATNFAALRNTNLSYFAATDPQLGVPDSILAGDRNIEHRSNSVVRLRRNQPLRWTSEMHEYKGNVLFADGHVELENNTLEQPASANPTYTSLVMPSAPPPPIAPPPAVQANGWGGGGGGPAPVLGGNATVSTPASTNLAGGGTNFGMLTNLTINSGPPRLPTVQFTGPGPGGDPGPLPMPSFEHGKTGTVAAARAPKTDEEQVQEAHDNLVTTGQDLARKTTRSTYGLPWWLIVGLLLGCLWLLRRAHDNRPVRTSSQPQRKSYLVE